MTTQVRNSLYPSNSVQLERLGTSDSGVGILVSTSKGTKFVAVSRAEFLAAVAAELDAVIIPREELPEVGTHRTGGLHAGAYSAHAFDDAETLHRRALAYLAMAKHLEGLSPVEAEQVKALAELIDSTERHHGPVSAEHLAVVLARAGVRVGGDDK